MATATSARESTLSILTLSRDSAGTVRMNCRRLLKTNSRRPAGFVTFLRRSRRDSQPFWRLPVHLRAGVRHKPPLNWAGTRLRRVGILRRGHSSNSIRTRAACTRGTGTTARSGIWAPWIDLWPSRLHPGDSDLFVSRTEGLLFTGASGPRH
jgi:hypothetical protein